MNRTNLSFCITLLFLCAACFDSSAQETKPLRDQATVQLTFDEAEGPALDSAKVGESQDQGQLQNAARRVTSPFWNQAGKQALQLSAAQQQFVEIADAVDVDRPDALTFSLLTVNLLDPSDGAYHGLVAKRGAQDGKIFTNYGINFTMQADNFQVYINDGSGYRVVQFLTKEALPARKLVHLTATFFVGDAPGEDADSDADDVRIQLFINGQPITPKSVTKGFVSGQEGWITDVDVTQLVNNIPVSIGRSEAGGEYYEGVVDEFLMFPRALNPDEAKQLFLEVAGANVEQLIQNDLPATAARPELIRLSQPGFTVGSTITAVLVGKNLLNPDKVFLPVEGVEIAMQGEPKADRLGLKITVAPTARPGLYPLYVQTNEGVSDPLPVAIDILPHVAAAEVNTPEKPATLPVAIYGNLAGGQEPVVYFRGKKGEHLVADLELKRLGGKSNPVLELKAENGRPLTIAWGDSRLDGDVRLEFDLPADGLYYVELHDLVYRAPGPNSYRLKLGNLKLVDRPFPVAGTSGPLHFLPIGTGLDAQTEWATEIGSTANLRWIPLKLPQDSGVVGPWPFLLNSDALDIVESPVKGDNWQAIDATLTSQPFAVAIHGRLLTSRERDKYLLTVTPGQKLRFQLASVSLDSPLAGEVELLGHPQGNRLAISTDQPGEIDPTLEYTVPANVSQILVSIRDLFGRGDPRAVYRLEITNASRPRFSLSLQSQTVPLPEQGTAVVELQVDRQGYGGPIALAVAGQTGIELSPAVIPAGVSGPVLCRLQRKLADDSAWPLVKIVGSTVDVEPQVTRLATRGDNGVLPEFSDVIADGALPPTGVQLNLTNPPEKIFKGAPVPLSLKVERDAAVLDGKWPLRITSLTTEPQRLKVANQPNSGFLPVVQVTPSSILDSAVLEGTVTLEVPLDIAAKTIDLVLVADAMAHPYSERGLATAHSVPFRVAVDAAVAPTLDASTFQVAAETEHAIVGKLQRTAGFEAPVVATLIGLPAGYTVKPAEVAGDQNEFRILVTSPAVAAETAVPNVKLRVTTAGSMIAADQDVALKVMPKPAE